MRLAGRAFLLAFLAGCLLFAGPFDSPLGRASGGTGSQAPARVTVTLLSTTDLHGNLYPLDYYSNQPANRGLAKIATLVKQVRAERPHALLLDCGDTIQGTPLAFYFARKDTARPNPTIAVMNALRYDAMALGNHEFNYGLDVMWKAKREAKFPWLAANVKQTYKKAPQHFAPYIIKRIQGVRVGIVGFVTPGVPRWEVPAHYKGYEFEQIVDAAKRVIPPLRKKVDLLVVIAHSGLGRDPQVTATDYSDVAGENVILALARALPEIDIVFYGHSHQEMPEMLLNGVLLSQSKNWGQSLARADIVMERSPQGRWRVASKKSSTIPVNDQVAADPETLALAKPYHEATQKYLDAPIATSEKEMDGARARYEDHPFVDLIHKVQMEYGQADVSLATLFLTSARVPAGQVTVRQAAALYIYDNTLYTVEATGAQLKQALERAATYFTAWPLKEGERIRLPGFNADAAQGVNYVIDLTRPAGDRIRDLTYKGQPLDPNQKLRVAINNYRYAGGGQYESLKGLPVLYRSPVEMRDLLIEYVTRLGRIPAESDHNWKIVPPEAVEAMLEEVRRREEQRTVGPAASP
jgi:2',3'-cyclic-nucleotide 2'-phosphodiesterase/3'-nucleotidase